MIHTNKHGRPYVRPRREDYADGASFVRAVHEHNQRMANEANEAFDEALRRELKRGRQGRERRLRSKG